MADSDAQRRKPVTTGDFIAMKERGEKIAMLTCYDYLFARILTEAGVDVTGLSYCSFENGVTLYYPSEIPLIVSLDLG